MSFVTSESFCSKGNVLHVTDVPCRSFKAVQDLCTRRPFKDVLVRPQLPVAGLSDLFGPPQPGFALPEDLPALLQGPLRLLPAGTVENNPVEDKLAMLDYRVGNRT